MLFVNNMSVDKSELLTFAQICYYMSQRTVNYFFIHGRIGLFKYVGIFVHLDKYAYHVHCSILKLKRSLQQV